MYHDLFQICRADRKPGGKSCILRADERVQLALVAVRADEPCAQCRAAGGVRPLYGQICAVSACFFPLTATRPDWM